MCVCHVHWPSTINGAFIFHIIKTLHTNVFNYLITIVVVSTTTKLLVRDYVCECTVGVDSALILAMDPPLC